QPRSIHQKNVGPAVIVIIEDRHSCTGGLDNVFLGLDTAENVLHGESSSFGNIGEIGDWVDQRGVWSLHLLALTHANQKEQHPALDKNAKGALEIQGQQGYRRNNLELHDLLRMLGWLIENGQCYPLIPALFDIDACHPT